MEVDDESFRIGVGRQPSPEFQVVRCSYLHVLCVDSLLGGVTVALGVVLG
jgi:hypothetical protein